ncbi:MAG: (Fe-S)-binding protein [Acidimicrobiia bacterium]|nr:(Fe-S)-binding protein [Acidimicrobiia bacterium]
MASVCQLFVTCLVDGFAPQVGVAVLRLLEDAGYTVEFPFDQSCCGQPAHNAGYREQAVRMAVHTVEVLDATDGPIVVPSGSCSDMLIHHSPDLLAETTHAEAARRVAGRVSELTRFLLDNGIRPESASDGEPVAFHRSCHGLRGLGLDGTGEELLDAAGIERCELDGASECCGFGGLFSIEMPEVSTAMLETKIAQIEASGARTVVGGDISCLMHIAGGLHRKGSDIATAHIAEVLAGEDA